MLSGREVFEIWAHPASPWSAWAKPTLFATGEPVIGGELPLLPDFVWDNRMDRTWAAVVDLPGESSVMTGLAMAREGFRPVPLYNGCGGGPLTSAVETTSIRRLLFAAVANRVLRDLPLDAPPAFLLDSRRKTAPGILRPGMLDNRWICFPQDFPSASYLASKGIRNVVLVRADASRPQDDLLHVLRRWEEGGLEIHVQSVSEASPRPFAVPRPERFRSMLYALMARLGLRASYAGGFGSVIPQPSQG